MYRAAYDINNVVICIGMDENQSGSYNGVGTWCAFTFAVIPELANDVKEAMAAAGKLVSGLKIVNSEVVLRTLQEVQSDL